MTPEEAREVDEAIHEDPIDWHPEVQRMVRDEVVRLRAALEEAQAALVDALANISDALAGVQAKEQA